MTRGRRRHRWPFPMESSGYAERAEEAWPYATADEQEAMMSASAKPPWRRTHSEALALLRAEARQDAAVKAADSLG